ncbi:MAG: c-type cytochrome, partial [Acidobacteriota bacterium]
FEGSGDPVPTGDIGRGRELVGQKGCMGCHRIGENPTVRRTTRRDFGPALDRVGDKMTAQWVYDWVRDPKRYFPETNMPDLRLTDQEAADITAYLMTLRSGSPKPRPRTNGKLLDDTVFDFLTARLTHNQARQRLARMSEKEKKVFLGEKLVGRFGCFGCHRIGGFEKTLPVGVELTKEGSKMITRLDFGFAEIPHTKPAWFLQKLKDPRIFDIGKVKLPREKLKMPDFGFQDEEAEALVTVIMSFQKDVQPLASHRLLDEREAAVEAGRRIIQDKNCRGCHPIEGDGGAIQEVIKDQAFWPPNLLSEGQKVQSDWLFDFLRGPTPIRPWLKVKMPTFHFNDEDATTLVKYFASADKAPYPFQGMPGEPPPVQLLRAGKQTFEQFRCMSCHPVGPPPAGVAPGDLAPDLTMAWGRLRHDWIVKWLRDPQALMPGTRMPGFFYSDGEPMYPDADDRMKAVSAYVLTLGAPQAQDRRAAKR